MAEHPSFFAMWWRIATAESCNGEVRCADCSTSLRYDFVNHNKLHLLLLLNYFFKFNLI
jgi:hypothetical protein